MIYYIIGILIILFLIFIVFLILLGLKIEKFEFKIVQLFKEKNNQIPSIYEVTKGFLKKHDDIFKEILKLKKVDFSENSFNRVLAEKLNTHKRIHNELDFIFRISNKNQKLTRHGKYLFVKDIIIEKSDEIGKNIELYKKIIGQYNYMILLKNLTIIGLLFPFHKKSTM